jgi:DNA repair exonuclease SbcCD ATPase subunit
LEKELPYYEFWSVAFGDSGIRKFVIDGIIPALNAKIAYWMQFLIDGKIDLKFNNELEETIERNPSDGDPFVYYGMSGGEKRRLNLAVSQAFAHVMMLSSGTCPNIVFLDEVTTNIDQIGVVGVYNMIVELAKDRQVFITTHDQNLLELLDGCDLINLEKRKGFTRMQKS